MKLNIFKVPSDKVNSLAAKLNAVGMESVYCRQIDDWEAEFFFSKEPADIEIPWAAEFAEELAEVDTPANTAYFAAYVWRSQEHCFVLSFGKTHFYLREFCDGDFGLNMARRIGDEEDVRQKSTRRYAGRSRKEIRSYQKETRLDVESGESVEYLQAAIADTESWGKSAKFGASLLVAPPIEHDGLLDFLRKLAEESKREPLFRLPRTEIIKDDKLIAGYDSKLVQAIRENGTEFEENTHQLVGVDFVFSGHEQYSFQRQQRRSPVYDALGMDELRQFIADNHFNDNQVLQIKIKVTREDTTKGYKQDLKKALDYSIEDERVFLRRGEWVRFNEDYLTWLDQFIGTAIEVDTSYDDALKVIDHIEPCFNQSLADQGYRVADRDFSIAKAKGYRIEAWDLKQGRTAYAVKFGNAQELGYVCDQAINLLELYRNDRSALKDVELDTYCLWLGFTNKNMPQRLRDVKSIIFKQKLDAWVRKCQNLSIKPMVRIGQKLPTGDKQCCKDARRKATENTEKE